MAIKEITMPKLGESVTEGTISSWLVKPGDDVKKYDPLAEVTSDKVTAEVPSSFDGTIDKILIEEGETIGVEKTICTIKTEEKSSFIKKDKDTTPTTDLKKEEDVPVSASQPSEKNTRFSPAVIRLASEHHIDINKIQGSGKEGRITRKDIMQFVENNTTKEENNPQKENLSTKTKENRPKEKSLEKAGEDREIPVNGVRKAIAKHMVESKQTIPHAWMMVEADVTELVRYRDSMKEDFKQKEGYPITYFAFFVKAVAQALKEFPMLNSTWQEDKIIEHKDINISIAVSANDLLYVPVIKRADEKSVKGIAREIYELAKKARQNRLTAEEMSGGTFTVNSTGSFGSVQSMGIINHPQAAILQVESIIKRPIVINQMIAIRDMVNLCLSIDHRILDGLIAGRFLQKIKSIVQQMTKESISIY